MSTQDMVRQLRTFLNTAGRSAEPKKLVKAGENLLRLATEGQSTTRNDELNSLIFDLEEWIKENSH